jgi:hypothetical protein
MPDYDEPRARKLVGVARAVRSRLLLISTVGSYTVIVFSLIVLGAWLNRVMLRNLRAIDR